MLPWGEGQEASRTGHDARVHSQCLERMCNPGSACVGAANASYLTGPAGEAETRGVKMSTSVVTAAAERCSLDLAMYGLLYDERAAEWSSGCLFFLQAPHWLGWCQFSRICRSPVCVPQGQARVVYVCEVLMWKRLGGQRGHAVCPIVGDSGTIQVNFS